MSYSSTKTLWGSSIANVVDSNGGTDIEIVAAKTGYAIVVDCLFVSASAACTDFFMETGASTKIFPNSFLAANSSFSVYEPGIRTAASEALTFSATITGTISVFVRYHYEG